MDILSPRRTKVVATLVVRDEADILADMLEHALDEGVTHIFATDNASTDGSRGILGGYREVVSIEDSDDMSHNQEAHTTRMARMACRLNPDWIAHLDADEFWLGLGDIGAHVEAALWAVTAHVHPPPRSPGPRPVGRMGKYVDFRGHAREFKVVHRPSPDVLVKHGNHGVANMGPMGYCPEILRHHYPIRDPEQFRRKVDQGARALMSRGFVCERWYLWYEALRAGGIDAIYDRLAGAWDPYGDGDSPPEDLLRAVLSGYRVIPQTIDDIFRGLHDSGERAVVRSWSPSRRSRWRRAP